MVRINNQAALCDLAKLAANQVQEIIKLVYLARLSDSDLKLRLLEHLQSNENASVMDLVSLASIASSQRSFSHKEALSGPLPAFHTAPQHTPSVPVHPSFLRASLQWQSPALCTNCGLNHGWCDCFAKHKTCFHCGKIGHFRKLCCSAPKRQIAQINDQGDSHADMDVHTSADVQCLHSSLDIAATASKLVECKVNSNTVSMQLNSGAACSIIQHCTAKFLQLPIQLTNKQLCACDGKPLPVTGQTQVSLEFNGACWQQDFILVATPHKFGLLGWDVLSQAVVMQDFCGQVLEQLPAICGFKASLHIDRNTKDRFYLPRTVPVHLELEVRNDLQRLESLGIITPCSYEGIPNVLPVVWARKKSGNFRLYADYKVHINSRINNYAYPMPNTETIMAGLDSAKFFPSWI